MSIAKSFLMLGSMIMSSRILGVVREVMLSRFLGACAEMDAFLIAYKFPNFFRRVFAEGGFQSIFVPYYTDFFVKKKLNAAQYFSSRIFTIILFVMLLFSVIVFIFSKEFVFLMAPGFSSNPQKLALAIDFTRIIFPSIVFTSISSVYSSIFAVNRNFFSYSLPAILVNITLILSLIFFQDVASSGYRISFGTLFAGILQLIYFYFYAKYKNFTIPKIAKIRVSPKMKTMFKKLIPVLIGSGVAQVNILVDSLFCSFLNTGCITHIYFADRFIQLPLSIFGISVATIVLPEIAAKISKGEKKTSVEAANSALLFTFRMTIPSAIGLIALAHLMISALYGHGKFSEVDVENTACILRIFAIGLPAYVLSKILSAILFAQKNSKTPLVAAISSVVANIILNTILIKLFQENGAAMSTAISGIVSVCVMYRKSKEWFKIEKNLIFQILKQTTAAVIMGALIMLLLWISSCRNYTGEILILLVCSAIGIAAYCLLLLVFKDEGARTAFNFIKTRFNKKK